MSSIKSLGKLKEAYKKLPEVYEISVEEDGIIVDNAELSSEQTSTELLTSSQSSSDDVWLYGCVFVFSGSEEKVKERIETLFSIEVIKPTTIRYFRYSGVIIPRLWRIFPGYLFFRTRAADFSASEIQRLDDVVKILRYDNTSWIMVGSDREIAEELFRYKGTVGVSKGHFVDGRLKITDGYLLNYQESIRKVDKRHQSAMVELTFNDKLMNLWLSYELEEEIKK